MFRGTFFSTHKFSDENEATDLLRLLGEYTALTPTRFEERHKRTYLPLYRPNDLTIPARMLIKGSLFVQNELFEATFTWGRRYPARWDMILRDGFFKENGRLLLLTDFVSSLSRRFPVLFGGVGPEEDWQAKHWLDHPHEGGGVVRRCYGAYLVRALPGIYWLTLFGSELTAHFRRDTITSLENIHSSIDLGPNGVAIMVRENPTAETLRVRLDHDYEIAKALGKEYFFDIEELAMPCRPIKDVTDWDYS